MGRAIAITFVLAAVACEQTNGDPSPPTVVSAPTTTSTTSAPPAPPPPPPDDAGADADAEAGSCAGFADPATTAPCHASCKTAPCNANGCFGAYYCDLTAIKCVPKPASCP